MAKVLALAFAMWVVGSAASAGTPTGFYLAGAQLYSCSADGTNGGPGAYGPAYQYSTNSATTHQPLTVNGVSSAILFQLSDGANVFSFTTGGLDPGPYACLNVFFDNDGISFNPPYDINSPKPGALTVVAPVAGAGFTFPAQFIDVQSFNSSGNDVVPTGYSGRTFTTVSPGVVATVSDFTVDAQIDGSFTIEVPESDTAPDTLAAGSMLVLLVHCRPRPGRASRATLARACDGSFPRC
jgi:hypothetical protein